MERRKTGFEMVCKTRRDEFISAAASASFVDKVGKGRVRVVVCLLE